MWPQPEADIHLHQVLRLKMRGAIPLFLFMVWSLIKHRDNFAFAFCMSFFRRRKPILNCIMRSWIICTPHHILLERSNKDDEMGGGCNMKFMQSFGRKTLRKETTWKSFDITGSDTLQTSLFFSRSILSTRYRQTAYLLVYSLTGVASTAPSPSNRKLRGTASCRKGTHTHLLHRLYRASYVNRQRFCLVLGRCPIESRTGHRLSWQKFFEVFLFFSR
jgi:hypothetical protein